MIRLVVLLVALCAVNCVKEQQQYHDVQGDSKLKDGIAVNEARYIRSSCAQRPQLNYPCHNWITDANESVCEDNGPPIGNSYTNNVSDCCCVSCPYNNNISIDARVGANDLKMMWYAYSSQEATLMVNWTRPSSGGPAGYQLWVFITRDDGSVYHDSNGRRRCICLPPSTTSYTARVSLTTIFYIHIKLFSILRSDEQPCDNDYDNSNVLNINEKIPVYCWDLMGASFEKCGPMFPSAPQNLTAMSTLVNESAVMLWISWQPPAQYNPDIEMYTISINGDNYCTNETTLQYAVIRSADVRSYTVKVFASSGLVISYDIAKCYPPCCSYTGKCNCWSDPVSVTHNLDYTTSSSSSSTVTTNILPKNVTVTNTLMRNATTTNIMMTNTMTTNTMMTYTMTTSNIMTSTSLPVTASTGNGTSSELTVHHNGHNGLLIIIVVLITVITVAVAVAIMGVYLYQQRRKAAYQLVQPRPNEALLQQTLCKVFIIANSNFESIRRLCHRLAEHNIQQVYYQYVENDRCDGPGQLGIGAWTEKNFNESTMVLFICNQGFSSVWENNDGVTGRDSYAQIISCTKQLFHGYLLENKFSKFAVVLLQESDHQYVPHLLKNVKSFLVSDEEGLARYILQVPTHLPPCRVANH